MTIRPLHRSTLWILLVMAAATAYVGGCASNPAANLSPEGKAAFYGEAFMARVEQAQNQTIALVGVNGITREDVKPAIEVFVQIGKGGQDLAAALKVIDESNITADKQAAALRVRTALDVFQSLLVNINVRISSESARAKITQIIAAIKLGAALFDVVQRLAPYLPATAPRVGLGYVPALHMVGGVA